jgi:hypothetical protein
VSGRSCLFVAISCLMGAACGVTPTANPPGAASVSLDQMLDSVADVRSDCDAPAEVVSAVVGGDAIVSSSTIRQTSGVLELVCEISTASSARPIQIVVVAGETAPSDLAASVETSSGYIGVSALGDPVAAEQVVVALAGLVGEVNVPVGPSVAVVGGMPDWLAPVDGVHSSMSMSIEGAEMSALVASVELDGASEYANLRSAVDVRGCEITADSGPATDAPGFMFSATCDERSVVVSFTGEPGADMVVASTVELA